MTGEEDTNIRKLGSWDQFDMGKTGEGVRGKQEGGERKFHRGLDSMKSISFLCP